LGKIIYCDESGFSGHNLSDDGSPYFVFSSVCIENERAAAIVDHLKKRYQIQREIKGANLTKHGRGRIALTELIAECAPFAKLVAVDKKLALAGKLFEYIFEPSLSDNNQFFYDIGFHRYIANLLYAEFITGPKAAGALLPEFQRALRSLEESQFAALLSGHGNTRGDLTPSSLVIRFAISTKDAIQEEMKALRVEESIGKWVLDLSTTCLDGLLSSWGEGIDDMEVLCDNSKPLQELERSFRSRVGKHPKRYVEIAGRRRLLTYSLAKPIAFGTSRLSPGLQLADAVASAFSCSLNNENDLEALGWRKLLWDAGAVHEDCMFPELELADITTPKGALNAAVLVELIRRAEAREPLLHGIPEFVRSISLQMGEIMKMIHEHE
jgi:hypothetical protein